MNKYRIFILCIGLLMAVQSLAQSQRGDLIRIMVSPDNDDMVYSIGEPINFRVSVYQFGRLLRDASIHYTIGPEKMDPWKEADTTLTQGQAMVPGGSMDTPGFVRCHVTCEVNGELYQNSGTAGVDPDLIQPTVTLPEDFSSFWQENLDALAEVPVEAEVTLMPERSTARSNVYHVNIRNIEGRIYGILSVPKAPGAYPAILHVPGAGIRPYYGSYIDEPVISLQIGIHGVPVNLYESDLYDDLRQGALQSYWVTNMDDRDRYYYKRVYLGCVRAVDWLVQHPAFDGENLGVTGGSQGGALSIITAGLDPRIDYLVSYYPALCDLTGYLHGRAGGWPHMFRDDFTNKPQKIEVAAYYDVVNFARQVSATGWYSMGYNDNVCPPTSIYAAYNTVPADKSMHLYLDAAHWTYPEQRDEASKWLMKQLGVETSAD